MKIKLNLNTIKTVAAFVAPVAISAGTSYFSTKKNRLDKLAAKVLKEKKEAETSYNSNKIKWDEFDAIRKNLISEALEEEKTMNKEAADMAWTQFGAGLIFAGASMITGKKFGWKVGLAVEAVSLIVESVLGYKLRSKWMDVKENIEEMKSDIKGGALWIGARGIFKYGFNKGVQDTHDFAHASMVENAINQMFPETKTKLNPDFGASKKLIIESTDDLDSFKFAFKRGTDAFNNVFSKRKGGIA